ncbi:hypothetical protein [Planomonospora parontospora]|uniref:hypothetical protein n=1 Tax=Planomonospora parontospora TaxID=58119 RepID=UPI001671303E|nr:hypothetical protein [Planomonospora parontospora]GGL42470.1 hypothetical protein GCM10014719_49750 [Planomonospora parontospora subsp. antibiotica]GII18386.1 hypothetical protein Ppa05_51120 [Planomonospora parontospora subsp. antibiotica]
MAYAPTVSEQCVKEFTDAAAGTLLVAVSGCGWIVDGDYYEKHLAGAFVIMSREDLDAIDADTPGLHPALHGQLMTSHVAEVIPEGPEPHVIYRCPICWEQVRRGQPWTITPGMPPQHWHHLDGEPLCPVMGVGGYVPAAPVPAFR